MKEANNNIPQHWKTVQIKDIAVTMGGYAFKSGDFLEDGKYQVLRMGNVRPGIIRYNESPIFLNTKDENILNRSLLQLNDVIITQTGTRKKRDYGFTALITKQNLLLNQRIAAIRFSEHYYPKFFLYFSWTDFFKDQFFANETGNVGQGNVGMKAVTETFIPLPPLPEQVAIVNKIEELFSELENGKEQILTAQRQLKIYRQSLLKAAFEGRLTNEKVKDGELPKGWKWVKSGEIFDFVTSGSRGWAKYYSMSGAIFIRITNLDFDSLDLDLEESKIQYVNPPSNSEGIRTKVKEGDFLFSITGYLGMFAIAPKLENAYVNQHVCLCRPKDGFIKKYVGYWIISKSGGHHYLNKNQKGAVKAGLTLDDIKNFPIPLPPLPIQQAIVEILESKLTVCDKLEETISHSLWQTETLRQSILKKAFEGKLV